MKNKNAFTLVELLAVIAILGLIMILAVPKIQNSVNSNKKRTFIINAKNIVRQLEYDNVEFNTFTKIPLEDLGLKKLSSQNIDLKNSVAYMVDDEIVLDLVGKNSYKNFYLCNVGYTNEEYIVQNTSCDTEHNFVYIDFSVDLDGGSTNQKFNSKYVSGNYLVLEIPSKTDKTFMGWDLVSGDSTLEQNRIKFGTEATEIKAIWGNNPEFVVNLNGGTSSQKFDSKYSGGTTIVLEEPTREGYLFKGWKVVTGNAILSGNVVTIGTTDTVIEAIWDLNLHTITYELNGGTKGENAPTSGKSGSFVLVSNPSKDGYSFAGWDVFGTGASISGTILTMGSSDVILVANWEANAYTITYELNGGTLGSNSPTSGTYGSTVELSNPSKRGYKFTGWTASGTGSILSGNNLTIGSSNITLIANWKSMNPVESYSCANSSSGSSPYLLTYSSDCEVIDDGSGNWRIKFLKQGTLKITDNMIIDAFLVGGGGGGGSGSSYYSGGGGGGGGYTITGSVELKSGKEYKIVIGEGGRPSANGTETKAFSLIANGGEGGSGNSGGSGGSGGGGGGYQENTGVAAGDGGSNGLVGFHGKYSAGSGQETSTHEFGDTSLPLYAGGGGGGAGFHSSSTKNGSGGLGGGAPGATKGIGESAEPNTGGGGGGGTSSQGGTIYTGGSGGSGVVVIRNSEATIDFDMEYSGEYAYIYDDNGNWRIKFLTSGNLIPHENMVIDAFLVGGGGGGSNAKGFYSSGGGGGGGYTTTGSVELKSGTKYEIIIGEGGSSGANGNPTKAFHMIANGGNGGFENSGGSGGSGGGGGGYQENTGVAAGDGGSNGLVGFHGKYSAGAGQQTSTYEFGDVSLPLYAGGGGGGAGFHSVSTKHGTGGTGGGALGGYNGIGGTAAPNTGGGGGGATATQSSDIVNVGGSGGSGVVVIRKSEVTIDFDMEYTGDYTYTHDEKNNWKIKFLTSGILTPHENMVIDAFLVGGGGGGGNGASFYSGGGGGGSGYTTTGSVELKSGTRYEIIIGEGGIAGQNGTVTTAFDLSANGGSGGGDAGTSGTGGSGGSGGGGGGYMYNSAGNDAGNGGINGSDGKTGKYAGGTGQNASTYEFGDISLTLYAGGGGGGSGLSGATSKNGAGGTGGGAIGGYYGIGGTAVPNTGGGGGGGGSAYTSGKVYPGGTGGSGAVVIRKKI